MDAIDADELKLFQQELKKYNRYPFGICGNMVLDHSTSKRTYFEAAKVLETSKDLRSRAVGLWAIARVIDSDAKITLSDGRTCDRKALNIEAIRCDPDLSDGYYNLAATLVGEDTAILPDGRCVNKRELYFETLARVPSDKAHIYCNLWSTLAAGETVTFPDGRVYDERHLLLEALQYDPEYGTAYYSLGCDLASGEVVLLLDGRTMTERDLYYESLRFSSNAAPTYRSLALSLASGETATLPDGRELDFKQLVMEAIRCDPRYGLAYYSLATALAPGETCTLLDGRELSDQGLFLEALRFTHNNSDIFYALGTTIHADETLELPDGRQFTALQLFLEALRLDSQNAYAYSAIGATLETTQPGTTVQIHDGRTLDARALFLEAISTDPGFADGYYNLFTVVSTSAITVLLDGRAVTVPQLLMEVLMCRPDHEGALTALSFEPIAELAAMEPWHRRYHGAFGRATNKLFSTLLMALQRLEEMGVLPPAHHSMLEDMLEGWSWGATQDLTED